MKKIYGLLLALIIRLAGTDTAKCIDARLRFHRKLNLCDPQTLPEKISWLSLHSDLAKMAQCTDKWEVREYVRQKGLGNILVPTYGEPAADFEHIKFQELPEAFIIKATHGCKMNYICENKEKLNLEELERTINKWLGSRYGSYSVEPHYSRIKPRVIVEKLIQEPGGLKDYKFFCYNGEPSWILVCGEREKGIHDESIVSLYQFDTSWNQIYKVIGWKHHRPGSLDIPRPKHLDIMLDTARKLSEDFPFVRVDLYDCNEGIYFGELTFTPASGVLPAYDQQFLKSEGKKLVLN